MNQLIKKKSEKMWLFKKQNKLKQKKGEAFTFSIYRFVDVKQLDLERNYAENEKEKNRDLLQSWLKKKKVKQQRSRKEDQSKRQAFVITHDCL